MTDRREILAMVPGALALGLLQPETLMAEEMLGHAQGEMAGEVTSTTVLLQSRLTASAELVDGDVPGAAGWARFQYSETADFADFRETDWLEAKADEDFIVRSLIRELKPGRVYHYRLVYGANRNLTVTGSARRFKTLPGADRPAPIRFVAGNCMNYAFFLNGRKGDGTGACANPEDRKLGYPGLEAVRKLNPDFYVGMGDTVYYDHPAKTAAKTLAEMRRKWHEQFTMPRLVELLSQTACYWMKDDHDHRYNDSDRGVKRLPDHDLGVRTFREQMPIVASPDSKDATYRTHRCGKFLQIWLVEGRDYRSPNVSPDGPQKTLWGTEQLDWLRRTILASDAPFKLLLTPTPLVGPDDAYKIDNHASHNGFRHEGEAFLAWLQENRQTNLAIITGDRHWHYHSIHPSGCEEFSVGAFNTENARVGRKPGDPNSTDPMALVKQPYTDVRPTGGFLLVDIEPPSDKRSARMTLSLRDDKGKELYSVTKMA